MWGKTGIMIDDHHKSGARQRGERFGWPCSSSGMKSGAGSRLSESMSNTDGETTAVGVLIVG